MAGSGVGLDLTASKRPGCRREPVRLFESAQAAMAFLMSARVGK
jgi:hypothetical protein